MIVGPIKTLFMDDISTGLDSSTTFQIVNSLRQAIHILGGTAVLSLLQPAPETYELFDDIILLSDGHIVYQGSRTHAPQFFESMGFKCPERKGYADFLQEVTSRKDQHKYWVGEHEYRYIPIMEFVDAFHSFHEGEKLKEEMSVPFDRSKSHPSALVMSKYGIKRIELLKACAWRELILIKRNSIVYAFRAVQVALMSFITMTLFLRTNMHGESVIDGGIYMGFLYYSVLIMLINAFSELALTIVNLPIITKQRDYHFYPAWAYTIPMWLLKIPFSFSETSIWLLLNYFAIGLDPSIERFLKCYILLVVTNQTSVGLFRVMAAIGRVMAVANAYASLAFGLSIVLGGFLISHDDLKKWWVWAYWLSPLMYSQNAISVNEFLGTNWNRMIPNSNVTLGIQILESRGIVPEANRYWIGVVVLLAYVLLFNFFFTLTVSYAKKIGRDNQVISKETLREKRICITGKHEDSSFEGNNSTHKHEYKNKVIDLSHESKGMVLPFIPLVVAFDNISYSIDMPQEMKEMGAKDDRLKLLNGVSGSLRPGILTALMGVSGAGKTTLMDVLAGRKTGGYTEGNITINGYPKQQEAFTRVLGYCEQNDIHSANITVYESLVFSAWLRLPPDVDAPTRKMFIEEIMELVELSSIRKALVGAPTEEFGLSLEQRKRLTIAVEIVANPSIIFMDEPTSGLDSRAASIVMRTVRNIVDTKRTVLCTIHQPSIDIFEAFDERIPVWWRWYYWACPVSWTLRGLIETQYGDDMAYLDANQTMAQFIKSHFGFSHDHLEEPAVMVAFFAVLFPTVFAVAINLDRNGGPPLFAELVYLVHNPVPVHLARVRWGLYWRHLLTAEVMANISRMYVDFFCMAGDSFLLKYDMVLLVCFNIAPIPVPEASISNINGSWKLVRSSLLHQPQCQSNLLPAFARSSQDMDPFV
ncbi:putative pleiotropic drug resistance protein 7 [Platanthera zijinensis]|uniref:Pleiotropic drug resistance protein 7 n=1 Tax=Platanthera zijinensis TaxID=2320716 RepID=A0AAP0G5J1_9ASPA